MKGFFDLRSSRDLFGKLQADFDRLKADPVNSHVAFDFCVTAWHLVEWHFPQVAARKAFCTDHPVLSICEHLAVGAKHFEPKDRKLTSVATTGNVTVSLPGAWKPTAWAKGSWGGELVVYLEGDAAVAFGPTLSVIRLAETTMAVWGSQF
jgi:hypothetical protein